MPHIGDDYLTPKQYQALRQKYREAGTTTPWETGGNYARINLTARTA